MDYVEPLQISKQNETEGKKRKRIVVVDRVGWNGVRIYFISQTPATSQPCSGPSSTPPSSTTLIPLIYSTLSPCGLASMVTIRATQLGSQQWLTKRAMLPLLVASTMSPEDASTVNI